MKIREIMTSEPATCTLNTSLHKVAQLMADHDCGCIPVLADESKSLPIGVITDRDIALRTLAHNKNPLNMVAGEVMTDTVVTADADGTVEECCETMEKNHLRRLVVVDENGLLCGMISQADIALAAPGPETAHLVRKISESNLTMTA